MPRPRHPRIALSMAIALFVAACSGVPVESGGPSGPLTIDSHEDGDTVTTASIQLRGTAPPNAEIVQDITFASDKRTSADADGEWVLTVDLDEGPNDLTLRVGDDESTSKTIRITYEPGTASTDEPPSEGAEATPAPTEEPTESFTTFGSGDLIVGSDVEAGTYRTRETSDLCYWERLNGFGGSLDEIISNGTGSGYFTVRIASTDAGFNSSGCGTWSSDLSAVTESPDGPITEDGTYIVGTDISAGTWRNDGPSEFGCYVARLSGFGGTLNEVITNDIATEGSLVITVDPSDVGFQTNGCGTWTKAG